MKLYLSLVALALTTLPAYSQALYSIGGKTVETKDLTPAQQQQMFEIQYEAYEKSRQVIDAFVLENHFATEAEKQKKSKEEVSNKLLEVKEPSDKDIKKWYDDNKSRIPPNYKFEDIKGDIAKFVKQEKMKSKREELLEKLKKDQKFSLMTVKPQAPVVDVKIDGYPAKGKDGAKVTIIEFADYQCPHCKHAGESLKKLVEKMKDKVKLVYVDYPINPSGVSKAVAEASHCVAEQGKFWEFHYKAFETQSTLEMASGEKLAKELKVDEGKFKACMDSGKGKALVEKGKQEGERIGITGTPHILINGRRYLGAPTVEALTKEVELALK